jgi:hypothetical protein
VLYIDAENGPRRVKGRISTLFPNEQDRPDLSRLEWVTETPLLGKTFFAELDRWRTSVKAPRLIVIDVLQRIKPPGHSTRNAYENDYAIWSPLQQWATEHRLAVLGVHHLKKGGTDDPLESLSGSNGLGAVADAVLVLNSDQNGKTLYVRGRDIEEKDTAVTFNGGHWAIRGEASVVRQSDERKVIVELLTDNLVPMTPNEIATALARPANNIKQLLYKMAKAGAVQKPKRGYYGLDPTKRDNPITSIT